jgi:LPS sulfotransferase NodH
MMRPIAEVIASQQAMTSRLGTKGASLDRDQLERGLRAHREEVRRWGRTAADVEWLEIDYPALIRDPASAIAKLVDFLGRERLPDEHAMTTVIDASLHRRKS